MPQNCRCCHPCQPNPCRKRTCECDFIIRANDIGSNGITINIPGVWCLCENVIYEPNANNNPAIRIAVSNVTLDLKGHTLSQATKNTLNTIGIVVNPGLTNVIIKNGTVRDFSKVGIQVGDFSLNPAAIASRKNKITNFSFANNKLSVDTKQVSAIQVNEATVIGVEINNIKSLNNGSQDLNALVDFSGMGGLVVLNAQDIKVLNSDLNNNFMSGFWGIDLTKLYIDGSHMDDNSWANLFAPNLALIFVCLVAGISRDIKISHSTFNNNFSIGALRGLDIGEGNFGANATNVTVEYCEAKDNRIVLSNPDVAAALSPLVTSQAINIDFSTNVNITNCQIHNSSVILNTPIAPSFAASGLSTVRGLNFGFANNANIENVTSYGHTFENNSGVGLNVSNAGIASFISRDIRFKNCVTGGNRTTYNDASTPTPANPSIFLTSGVDFFVGGPTIFDDCVANDNVHSAINVDDLFSIVSGFNTHSSASDILDSVVVYRRCIALNNRDDLSGVAAGFTTRPPVIPGLPNNANVFDECISENNISNEGISAGFDLYNVQNSKITNNKADNNGVGILLTGSSFNLIRENDVASNSGPGIQLDAASINNLIKDNTIFNNIGGSICNNGSGNTFINNTDTLNGIC